MNYRDERAHDLLIISLANDLFAAGHLSVIEQALLLPPLGALEVARRHRDFDVELTFSNASLVIETKVDSDENGRWDKPREWQTERIYRLTQSVTWLKPVKHYLFITYGFSEFFGKPFNRGPGSTSFRHIGLDRMVDLLRRVSTLQVTNSSEYRTWLLQMEREQNIRATAPGLLVEFARFRSEYLRLSGDIDFDRNRILFCAPEIAFPVLGDLADLWNTEPSIRGDLGRVSVYPVARMSPTIVDSILNFWELWDSGRPSFFGRLLKIKAGAYFEMNEDLNLNLKLDENGMIVPDNVILDVQAALDKSGLPDGVRGQRRNYRQGTRVIYEWDLQSAENATDLSRLARRIADVLHCTLDAVA